MPDIGVPPFSRDPSNEGSEAVALLLPGIGVVVVAVALPEARPVGAESSIPRSHLALFQKYLWGMTRRSG